MEIHRHREGHRQVLAVGALRDGRSCHGRIVERSHSHPERLVPDPLDDLIVGGSAATARRSRVYAQGRKSSAFAEAMLKGADDFLPHPLDLTHLAAKVQYALRLKSAQDRADRFG